MTEYNNQQQHLQNDENENGSGLTLHDLLQMVLANWYWFALSVLICLGMAYYYLASTPKIYSRTATILVKDSRKGGDMELGAFSDLVGFQNRRTGCGRSTSTDARPSKSISSTTTTSAFRSR